MIIKNSPKVRIVTGRVKKVMIGLTKLLTMPNTIATTIADKKLSTCTPDNTAEAAKTANPFNSKDIKNF